MRLRRTQSLAMLATRQWRPFQVAAGENPMTVISPLPTDISQGCELTPEVGLKNEAPARAYSTGAPT